MCISDFERINKYTEYIDENKLKHSQDRLFSYLIGIENLGMDYIAIEKFLQDISPISMTKKDFLNRAIGYWLYTRTERLCLNAPSKQCIDALRVVIAELSTGSDVMCKIEHYRAGYFVRLFDITKKCMSNKNIFYLEQS